MREKLTTFMIIQLIFVFLAAVAFAAPGDGGGDGVGDGEGNPDATRPGMFRKNVSRTPEMTSTKSKLNTMRMWFPALRADGDPATYKDDDNETQPGIPYYDYTCEETNEETGECLEWKRHLIRDTDQAKPIVVVYTDAIEETGCEDVFAAVSRDDGKTFKRTNLSRMADESSFTLANGEEYCGQVKKPVFQICGNNILVAWTSKFCKGGKPCYAIDTTDEYTYDDPYYEDDIWGVSGPQKSVDYTVGEGPIADYPEVGEVPYSCVWVVRGTIVTQGMINSETDGFWAQYPVGHIVWFKPERLTSGRRDAIQAFMGMGDGAGFGLTWQEDPAGLRPGKMAGPGHGWSGATVHHKTDIWYSFMTQADFRKIDIYFESSGDPEHTNENFIAERPKALVPMALPVRISDNDVVNTESMKVQLYDNGYPVVDSTTGNFIPLNGSSSISEVSYAPENLTRCVKFVGGNTIVEIGSTEDADYYALPSLPDNHKSSMSCTNCHVPFGTDSGTNDAPTQGSPVPLVVVDAATPEYLGGFTNSDCVSCHYSHVVPRDRVIAVAESECAENGGEWIETIEAYYPYEGYPYIAGVDGDASGTHRYGYMLPEMCDTYKQSVSDNGGNATTEPNWDNVLLSNWYDFVNNQEVAKRVLVTDDERLLDGDTGASRPNLFLKPFTKPDGSKGAWAIMAYEETKGVGAGPPANAGEQEQPDETGEGDDRYFPDNGKNVIYHSFEYTNPDKVSAGDIVNLPERNADGSLAYLYEVERDDDGVPLTDDDGNFIPLYENGELVLILDFQGNPILAYENGRRPRFIIQGKSAIGNSRTVMVVLYKEGQDGQGRQSDIMMRRFVVPGGQTGNPYRFSNLVDGVQNMSSVTSTETWTNPEAEPDAKGDQTKVVCWQQFVDNLNDKSDTNPYDDARAHRGAIRGDFILMGYSWTPNWASARNAHDKYDFHVRRSFDGGETWTTDPAGSGVTHYDTFKIYEEGGTEEDDEGREKYTDETFYPAGAFEGALNISQLPNNKESVIEPRIVGTPSTIKADGQPTGFPEDVQNQNVVYLTFGTASNVPKPSGSSDDEAEELESAVPADLFYTFTQDKGETFVETSWVVQGDPQGEDAPETGDTVTGWDWLAKDSAIELEQGEAQIRMTPDGSRFYATWLEENEEESDIWFRRIMPSEFECNVANVVAGTTVDEDEVTPLAGIIVRIYQQDIGLLEQTVTNEDGAFTFDELSEESYVVTVEGNSAGFEEPVVNVTLSADSPKARVQFKKKGGVPGDLDGDGDVDSADYMVFRSTLGKCAGDAGFNSAADYDGDGCITYADYRIWYGYFRS